MRLGTSLAATAEFPRPEKLAAFAEHLPHEWIERALQATGTATLRRRRLPAEQVVWLVLGMALFRDRSIVEVVDKLDLALPGVGDAPVAPSAVAQARARLGQEPMAWLFSHASQHWAPASADRRRWRGLALHAVDGTSWRVPDTQGNRDHFGCAKGRTESGYPLVRLVALMALRSHLITAARFGPYSASEQRYANELWQHVPDHSLTIVDRGFFDAGVLIPLFRAGQERHWLIRAKSTTSWRVVKRLGPKDELVEMNVSDGDHGGNEVRPRCPVRTRHQHVGGWSVGDLLAGEAICAQGSATDPERVSLPPLFARRGPAPQDRA